MLISREEVILNCFILFSLDYGKNIGHRRSHWRDYSIGYEYISKYNYFNNWINDERQDNFNSSEWGAFRRLFH